MNNIILTCFLCSATFTTVLSSSPSPAEIVLSDKSKTDPNDHSDLCPSYDILAKGQLCAIPALPLASTAITSLSQCEAECAKYAWCNVISWREEMNETKALIKNSPMQCSSKGEMITDLSFTNPNDFLSSKSIGSSTGNGNSNNAPNATTDSTTDTGTTPSTTPPPVVRDDCIAAKSVPNDCSNCVDHDQCAEGGFCCPYMKKCVTSSSQGCGGPIANCRPPCHDAECPACTNRDYIEGKWQKPTCPDSKKNRRSLDTDTTSKVPHYFSDFTGTLMLEDIKDHHRKDLLLRVHNHKNDKNDKNDNNDNNDNKDNNDNHLRSSITPRKLKGSVSEVDKLSFLNAHNKLRAETSYRKNAGRQKDFNPIPTDMKALSWSNALQQTAQNYANKCIWAHNPNAGAGENLAAGSAGMSPKMATELWDDEKSGWYYDTNECTIPQCGHFTQTSWAKTTEIGCGIADCSSIENLNYGGIYVVCNYSPQGNVHEEDWTVKGVSDCGGYGDCNNCNTQTDHTVVECKKHCCDGSFMLGNPWEVASKEDRQKETTRASQCTSKTDKNGKTIETKATEYVDGSGDGFHICASTGQLGEPLEDVSEKFGTSATSAASTNSASSATPSTKSSRSNGLIGGSTSKGSLLEPYSCILSKPCDGNTVLAKGWVVKEKVRMSLPAIELAGEVNWTMTFIAAVICGCIIGTLLIFVACHARKEGRLSRQRLQQHRSGIQTLHKNGIHQRSSKSIMNPMKKMKKEVTQKESAEKNTNNKEMNTVAFLFCLSHKTILLRVSQCICSLIPFPIVIALTNFEVSWLARGWIATHVLTCTYCLFQIVHSIATRKGIDSSSSSSSSSSASSSPLFEFALPLGIDLLLVILLGLSSVTITGVESINFNTIPKMSFDAALVFTYFGFIFSLGAFFMSYAKWNDANCPDGGVGTSLRRHAGKSSAILTVLLCMQVGCSLFVFSLVLGTPFYWLFPSAMALASGCILQFVVAVIALYLQRVVSEDTLAKGVCGKCCAGKNKTDKHYLGCFLLFDAISMVVNAVSGLYCGDQLKGPTMWFACFFCFILFISYGITNVLYYLALRGDLPPMELVVGLTVLHGEENKTTDNNKIDQTDDKTDKVGIQNSAPPLPIRGGASGASATVARQAKGVFHNPLKNKGRKHHVHKEEK